MSAANNNNTTTTLAFTMQPIVNAGTSMAHQQIDDQAAFSKNVNAFAETTMASMTTTADSAVLDATLAQSIDDNNAEAGRALLKALKGDTAEGNVAEAAAIPLQDQLAPATGAMHLEPLEAIQQVAETAPSQTILDKLGLPSLTYAELKELSAAATKAALERCQDELKRLLEDCIKKADELGVHEWDVIARLKALYAHRGLRRGLSQAGSHTAGGYAVDKTGHKPIVGATYKHPTRGKEWTKARPQGMVNQEFLALIEAGHTWEELKVSP